MKSYERFLNYAAIDTESKHDSSSVPSTQKQKDLSNILVKELKELGITDAYMSDYGFVYATIPANYEKCDAPIIGFIAHMDTSPDLSGNNVKAKIIKNYDGKDIILNEKNNIVMKTNEFEHLKNYIGDDLIVTDGTTLLGADDKAGIAEIMAMAEYFMDNPNVKHGSIKLAFTPDEEVGNGIEKFDVENFKVDFAYTLDGGAIGDVSCETFNAADAKIKIVGTNIHPGQAKNKMINSIIIAKEFDSMLPVFENPANTENYEGFNHITDFVGTVELTNLKYIIRDHDRNKFESKKNRFIKIADYLNEKYSEKLVEVELVDSYYNMNEKIKPMPYIMDAVKKAMIKNDVTPKEAPMRGGTDGANLSFKGIPCPNICTGGHNFHSRYEYIPIQSMEKIVDIIIDVVKFYTSK